MQSVTKILTAVVSEAFGKCGYDEKLGVVTPSDRLDLCQFQCNGAFSGAKLYKKAPFMIADDVAAVLKTEDIFAKVDVVKPGFLNLTLSDEYMLKIVKEIESDKFCGIPQAETPQKIVIDY
ncbi:MAG: arginine--tRNA ligase, partial [Ruminococcus sp.]|nr:arginine--tRNA ligase [Ruminococcus sp.]